MWAVRKYTPDWFTSLNYSTLPAMYQQLCIFWCPKLDVNFKVTLSSDTFWVEHKELAIWGGTSIMSFFFFFFLPISSKFYQKLFKLWLFSKFVLSLTICFYVTKNDPFSYLYVFIVAFHVTFLCISVRCS